ncbi:MULTISPECIES: TetR/AcrR family transcriptional regulator [Pseudonocardia]|uniref:HTH-type transcriptional repressor KstR2 n=2 Tax=Pseudonocardia TaxID=1847 RepID=A0A1Y2N5U0_PSEAH|nr:MULTISPECIES: TetR/AcrR family transcriptional regulator [Pseudonocardia]OSY42834.1 HTH-type transcriptional repressor KstR2 [Pseudonocardia autotrophica]TDN77411.1 TetR family transcriptional regulator [Pseudonocardia autotrophica]BBG01435.1 TetR family transcriptional regulator [Pseudonocardia autotrophica]GEC24492.1 TetR family transcriptional regulator [Pseudonocardia saturnea]
MNADPSDGHRPSRGGTRKAELVALASRMFREHGFHGVGMRALADAAGMQAASLYHHFRSKEELLLHTIYVVDRDMVVEQMPLLDGPESHAERLARLVRAHITHIGANRDAWLVAGRELRALSPDRLEAVQSYRRDYQRRIARHLAEGVEAGEFGCPDPRLATLAILDLINGPNEWFDPAGRLSIEEIADRYAEMVVRQLAPPVPAERGEPTTRGNA